MDPNLIRAVPFFWPCSLKHTYQHTPKFVSTRRNSAAIYICFTFILAVVLDRDDETCAFRKKLIFITRFAKLTAVEFWLFRSFAAVA